MRACVAAAKAKLPGMLPTDDSVAYDSATLGELAAGARVSGPRLPHSFSSSTVA